MTFPDLRIVNRTEIHLFAQMTGGDGRGGNDRATILARIRQKHCRILIVDDEPLFRNSIELRMRRYQAELDFAAAGNRAIEKATSAERPFDLILLDIRLQKLNGSGAAEPDGVDVYDTLLHKGVTTPILFMTAYVDDNVREKVAARKKKLHRKESPALFEEIESILLHCRGGDA
jgi:CheY-like chemotaxis protein